MLGVSAFDAAGNASSQATTSATTSACAPTVPAGPGTASLWVAPTRECRRVVRAASPVGYAAACGGWESCVIRGRPRMRRRSLGDTVLIAGRDVHVVVEFRAVDVEDGVGGEL